MAKRLIAAAVGLYVAVLWVDVAGQGARPLPGDPLPGITSGDFEDFRLGLDDFTEVETVEDGLGPAFNGSSCAVCHSVPAIGGAGVVAEVRAARRDEHGEFIELAPTSGSGIGSHRFICSVEMPNASSSGNRSLVMPISFR